MNENSYLGDQPIHDDDVLVKTNEEISGQNDEIDGKHDASNRNSYESVDESGGKDVSNGGKDTSYERKYAGNGRKGGSNEKKDASNHENRSVTPATKDESRGNGSVGTSNGSVDTSNASEKSDVSRGGKDGGNVARVDVFKAFLGESETIEQISEDSVDAFGERNTSVGDVFDVRNNVLIESIHEEENDGVTLEYDDLEKDIVLMCEVGRRSTQGDCRAMEEVAYCTNKNRDRRSAQGICSYTNKNGDGSSTDEIFRSIQNIGSCTNENALQRENGNSQLSWSDVPCGKLYNDGTTPLSYDGPSDDLALPNTSEDELTLRYDIETNGASKQSYRNANRMTSQNKCKIICGPNESNVINEGYDNLYSDREQHLLRKGSGQCAEFVRSGENVNSYDICKGVNELSVRYGGNITSALLRESNECEDNNERTKQENEVRECNNQICDQYEANACNQSSNIVSQRCEASYSLYHRYEVSDSTSHLYEHGTIDNDLAIGGNYEHDTNNCDLAVGGNYFQDILFEPNTINYVEYSNGDSLRLYEDEPYTPIYLTHDGQFETLETYTIENLGVATPLGEELVSTYMIENVAPERVSERASMLGIAKEEHSSTSAMLIAEGNTDPNDSVVTSDVYFKIGHGFVEANNNNVGETMLKVLKDEARDGGIEETELDTDGGNVEPNHNVKVEVNEESSNCNVKNKEVVDDHQKELDRKDARVNISLKSNSKKSCCKSLTRKQRKELKTKGVKHSGVKHRMNLVDEEKKKSEGVTSRDERSSMFEQLDRINMQELNRTLRTNVDIEDGINKLLDNAQRDASSGRTSGNDGERIKFKTVLLKNDFPTQGTRSPRSNAKTGSNLVKYDVFEKEFKITDNDRKVIEEYILKRNNHTANQMETESKAKDIIKENLMDMLKSKKKVSERMTGENKEMSKKQIKNVYVTVKSPCKYRTSSARDSCETPCSQQDSFSAHLTSSVTSKDVKGRATTSHDRSEQTSVRTDLRKTKEKTNVHQEFVEEEPSGPNEGIERTSNKLNQSKPSQSHQKRTKKRLRTRRRLEVKEIPKNNIETVGNLSKLNCPLDEKVAGKNLPDQRVDKENRDQESPPNQCATKCKESNKTGNRHDKEPSISCHKSEYCENDINDDIERQFKELEKENNKILMEFIHEGKVINELAKCMEEKEESQVETDIRPSVGDGCGMIKHARKQKKKVDINKTNEIGGIEVDGAVGISDQKLSGIGGHIKEGVIAIDERLGIVYFDKDLSSGFDTNIDSNVNEDTMEEIDNDDSIDKEVGGIEDIVGIDANKYDGIERQVGGESYKRVEYTRDSLIITFNEKDGTLKIVPRVKNGVLVRQHEDSEAQNEGEEELNEASNKIEELEEDIEVEPANKVNVDVLIEEDLRECQKIDKKIGDVDMDVKNICRGVQIDFDRNERVDDLDDGNKQMEDLAVSYSRTDRNDILEQIGNGACIKNKARPARKDEQCQHVTDEKIFAGIDNVREKNIQDIRGKSKRSGKEILEVVDRRKEEECVVGRRKEIEGVVDRRRRGKKNKKSSRREDKRKDEPNDVGKSVTVAKENKVKDRDNGDDESFESRTQL